MNSEPLLSTKRHIFLWPGSPRLGRQKPWTRFPLLAKEKICALLCLPACTVGMGKAFISIGKAQGLGELRSRSWSQLSHVVGPVLTKEESHCQKARTLRAGSSS